MSQNRATFEDNYRRFIERVRTSGEVWGLRSDDGWAFCESSEYEDTDVLVFWSERAEAQKHAQGEWGGHAPAAIPLDEFVDNWLEGMEEDGALVGPNWDADLLGLEVEPLEVAEKLGGGEAYRCSSAHHPAIKHMPLPKPAADYRSKSRRDSPLPRKAG